MADFGFVGASYEAPSIYQDAQECINWFPEVDPTKPQGSRGVVALYPTPGLTSVVALAPQAEVRGMLTLTGGQAFVAVCGQYLYYINSSYTPHIVGQLASGSGRVGLKDNGTTVYITDGTNRYTWFINSATNNPVFTGYTSGTTLYVTFVKTFGSGIGAGQQLFGHSVLSNTVITGQLSGTTGGIGTYSINTSQTVSSTGLYSTPVASTLTAAISGTTLTVSSLTANTTLYPGMTIKGSGVTTGTIITALGNGTVLTTAIATAAAAVSTLHELPQGGRCCR